MGRPVRQGQRDFRGDKSVDSDSTFCYWETRAGQRRMEDEPKKMRRRWLVTTHKWWTTNGPVAHWGKITINHLSSCVVVLGALGKNRQKMDKRRNSRIVRVYVTSINVNPTDMDIALLTTEKRSLCWETKRKSQSFSCQTLLLFWAFAPYLLLLLKTFFLNLLLGECTHFFDHFGCPITISHCLNKLTEIREQVKSLFCFVFFSSLLVVCRICWLWVIT